MVKLLALLVLAVRFALHQRRPPGGDGPDGPDGPGGRRRPGDGNTPKAPDNLKGAQQSAEDSLKKGEPPGGGRQRPGEGEGEGEEGRPPDDSTDANNDGEEGAFTTPQPDGVPKKRDDKWLKKNGVDPHEVKGDLPGPMSHFDLYVDRSGNIWAVRKGADPRSGEYVGNMDDYAD
ncbi:polymorphic toxin type 33 domain-containing protein [Actinophytocola sp. KF-1]